MNSFMKTQQQVEAVVKLTHENICRSIQLDDLICYWHFVCHHAVAVFKELLLSGVNGGNVMVAWTATSCWSPAKVCE